MLSQPWSDLFIKGNFHFFKPMSISEEFLNENPGWRAQIKEPVIAVSARNL